MIAAARSAIARLDELCSGLPGAEPAFLGWEDATASPRNPLASDRVPASTRARPVQRGPALARPRSSSPPARTELAYLELNEVAELVARRAVSPVELCDVVLDRVARFDGELGAFITVTAELATERAAAAEKEIAAGHYRGPLHGVPISLKDLIATAGVRTTNGSKLDADVVPTADATVWRRLAEQGAVLIGKTNMMEFAYAAELVNERWGVTRNPWDLQRTAHGSSSGSAVAVATGMSYASLASETGASIQRPASFCGVVGMKPSYGRTSRAGVAPTAWSMDHVGVITRSVLDAAITLDVVSGYDPLDPTTRSGSRADQWSGGVRESGLRGLRVGIPRRHIDGQVDEEVETAFWLAADECRAAGATVHFVDPPELEYAATTSVTLRTAEAYSHHGPALRRRPDGYSDGLRRQLELGAALSAEDYLRAQRARRAIDAAMATMFSEVDVMISPATPTAATLIADGMAAVRDRPWEVGPHQHNLARVFSLLGLPVLSLPCGYTQGGLPISLQIGGRRFDEATVFAAALDYEQRTQWLRHPHRYA